MKHFSKLWLGGALLLASSIALYSMQILIFRRAGDTGFYFLQDLSFIPIYILLVVVIVDRFLKIREKQSIIKKMNMVIGAFFSECGKVDARKTVRRLVWLRTIKSEIGTRATTCGTLPAIG